jgi:transposase
VGVPDHGWRPGECAARGERTAPNPTDRGKTGTKRSQLVDGRGVPLGVAFAGANCNDHLLVLETLASVPAACPYPPEDIEIGVWLDKGYDIDEVYGVLRQNGYVPHIVPRDAERELKEKMAGYIPRRRPVARTISWQNRFRRILLRWEKKVANYLAMVHVASASNATKHAGLA